MCYSLDYGMKLRIMSACKLETQASLENRSQSKHEIANSPGGKTVLIGGICHVKVGAVESVGGRRY